MFFLCTFHLSKTDILTYHEILLCTLHHLSQVPNGPGRSLIGALFPCSPFALFFTGVGCLVTLPPLLPSHEFHVSPPNRYWKNHIISILAAMLFICASRLHRVEGRQVAQALTPGNGCIARAAHPWVQSGREFNTNVWAKLKWGTWSICWACEKWSITKCCFPAG